jgi:hypothetical protein
MITTWGSTPIGTVHSRFGERKLRSFAPSGLVRRRPNAKNGWEIRTSDSLVPSQQPMYGFRERMESKLDPPLETLDLRAGSPTRNSAALLAKTSFRQFHCFDPGNTIGARENVSLPVSGFYSATPRCRISRACFRLGSFFDTRWTGIRGFMIALNSNSAQFSSPNPWREA